MGRIGIGSPFISGEMWFNTGWVRVAGVTRRRLPEAARTPRETLRYSKSISALFIAKRDPSTVRMNALG